MDEVRITCGKQPSYFNFSASPATLQTTTTVVGASLPIPKDAVWLSFQAFMSAGTATVLLQGTNDPVTNAGTAANWVNLGTVTLPKTAGYTGDNTLSDGLTAISSWRWIRVYVSAISGGTLTCIAGC